MGEKDSTLKISGICLVPTCKRMFLLVVMGWKTPDEGVVELADVGIDVLQ